MSKNSWYGYVLADVLAGVFPGARGPANTTRPAVQGAQACVGDVPGLRGPASATCLYTCPPPGPRIPFLASCPGYPSWSGLYKVTCSSLPRPRIPLLAQGPGYPSWPDEAVSCRTSGPLTPRGSPSECARRRPWRPSDSSEVMSLRISLEPPVMSVIIPSSEMPWPPEATTQTRTSSSTAVSPSMSRPLSVAMAPSL